MRSVGEVEGERRRKGGVGGELCLSRPSSTQRARTDAQERVLPFQTALEARSDGPAAVRVIT